MVARFASQDWREERTRRVRHGGKSFFFPLWVLDEQSSGSSELSKIKAYPDWKAQCPFHSIYASQETLCILSIPIVPNRIVHIFMGRPVLVHKHLVDWSIDWLLIDEREREEKSIDEIQDEVMKDGLASLRYDQCNQLKNMKSRRRKQLNRIGPFILDHFAPWCGNEDAARVTQSFLKHNGKLYADKRKLTLTRRSELWCSPWDRQSGFPYNMATSNSVTPTVISFRNIVPVKEKIY